MGKKYHRKEKNMLILLSVCLLAAAIAWGCYRYAFYAPPRKPRDPELLDVPEGAAYEPHRENMERWIREARALPQEAVSVTSFDGLKLTGVYYEYAPGAPMELMFHGYRGNRERDLSGGVQRCFALGRSALLVDQRGSLDSQGNTISFGIREHRDCLAWVDFAVEKFGPDVKIILTGIFMGAATVMMVAGCELPENVIGVLADCGYSSVKDIMYHVAGKMHLPPRLCYPFIKLGARLFGHFDPDECSPVEALKKAKVPVIFFHGEEDSLVPCHMSRVCYDACASRKKLVIIPGAEHGLSYPTDPETYLNALREFFGPEGSYQEQKTNP